MLWHDLSPRPGARHCALRASLAVGLAVRCAMVRVRLLQGWCGMLAMLWVTASSSAAEKDPPMAFGEPVCAESIRPDYRTQVQAVLDKPTLRVFGPVETFRCKPNVYRWL